MKLFDIAEVEEIKPLRDEQTEIMVSIWCITYNHEEYIRNALDGIILQDTRYNYEIVIYDDASTDGTVDIIREYIQKYPHLFHAFLSKTNTYRHPKRMEFFNFLKKNFLTGKYILANIYFIIIHHLPD